MTFALHEAASGRAQAPQIEQPAAEPLERLLELLGATQGEGLLPSEAERRLATCGRNELPAPAPDPAWRRLLSQFTDPIVLTLLGAAVVAVFVGMKESGDRSLLMRFADAIAILIVVLLNALIGFFQERRAEAALEALRKLTAPTARVRRGGQRLEIAAALLVPGDLIELEAGDAVPADARLVQTFDLGTEESALTGESVPRGKDALAELARDTPLAERDNMVFTGTIVVRGKGRGVVTETGVHTELGRVGQMIASIGAQVTPLEARLAAFGKVILWVCLGLSATLMTWGFVRPLVLGGPGHPSAVLLLEAVALAVAAIPEGLPAITTITLALGMQRMAKRGAIVRRLPAVETLGAATVICSDKTGTLTQNEMTVRAVYTVGHAYEVTGQGYEPIGELKDEGGTATSPDALPQALEQLLATVALCNNAKLEKTTDGAWRVLGDPTEGALLALAEKGGRHPETARSSSVFVTEVPFDSSRKRMTVVARDRRGRELAHTKGSIDALLPLCEHAAVDDGTVPMTDELRRTITAAAQGLGRKALRVLAICQREAPADHAADSVERELTFLGLVAMMDPPRPGVAEAILACRAAGIRSVMITGDDKLTATAIADEIGMFDPTDEAITGGELEQLDDDALDRKLAHLRVFARTTPEQKLRIVRAFTRKKHVVAMTGDGVNDAPALREASIGVAMGKMGTDVARQAADLVLADDNFATIVDAVREGRAIYRNIQKSIFFLLSANAGLVFAVFTVSFFPSWPPLTPLMVLWINLVTNGLPALALGVDPTDRALMDEPPRDPTEALMVFRDYLGMAFVGVVIGGAAVVLYIDADSTSLGLPHARALAFSVLALSPLIHAFGCRSPIRSAFQGRPLFSKPLLLAVLASTAIHLVAVLVPALQPVFRTFPVSWREWGTVLGLAALVFPAVELAKLGNRRWFASRGMAPRSLMPRR